MLPPQNHSQKKCRFEIILDLFFSGTLFVCDMVWCRSDLIKTSYFMQSSGRKCSLDALFLQKNITLFQASHYLHDFAWHDKVGSRSKCVHGQTCGAGAVSSRHACTWNSMCQNIHVLGWTLRRYGRRLDQCCCLQSCERAKKSESLPKQGWIHEEGCHCSARTQFGCLVSRGWRLITNKIWNTKKTSPKLVKLSKNM